MATMITSECINCGACEPECPNTAIYQGGVEWQAPDGSKHPALSADIFYIVPEKCTECVGFHDHEACAAVCPVDACVPDPQRPETNDVLLARARALHPDKQIPDDAPSRFAGGGAPAPAAASAPPPPPAAPVSPAPKPAAPAAAAPARPAAGSGKVEKAVGTERAPRPERRFAGELPASYDQLVARLGPPRRRQGGVVPVLVALGQGVLGALPDGEKRQLAQAAGDARVFSAELATAANVFLNFVLYPLIVVGGVLATGGADAFSAGMHRPIFWGVALGGAEAIWRLRENVFRWIPLEQAPLRGAIYGFLLWPVSWGLRALLGARGIESGVGFDGFHAGSEQFESKMERARRYGEIYQLEDRDDAYLFRLEMPRALPPSSLRETLGLPDAMPDYDYDVEVVGGDLVVRARVADPDVRKLTSVAPAFPPAFTTRVRLADEVIGFRHRYQGKVIEVVLPKAAAS